MADDGFVPDAPPAAAPDGFVPDKPPSDGFVPDEQGSPLLKSAGQVASFLPRAGRALGVGIETTAENMAAAPTLRGLMASPITDPDAVQKGLAAGKAAFQPGYQPKPGEKLGAALGSLAGATPEIMAAGELAPTFLPEAPALSTLAQTALARAAHSAIVFGATGALDTTAENAALTGNVDPMKSLKAAAGGAVEGAALGAAGAVPALVSGRLPDAVTKVLSDEIASRMFGASVAGAVGAGASALGHGTKEDIAAHGAGFFLMDILGNSTFDAQYKQAAKDSAIKPLVDAMVGSGMDPTQAIPQARTMLENVLKETGNASQVIKDSPQYNEAVQYMAAEYAKANPGMDPIGAEQLAKRRLDVAFANGEMTIAELKKLKLTMAPEPPAAAAAEAPPVVPGATPALPAAEGSEAPPEAPPAAPQPHPGDRVVVPGDGAGHVEGQVVGYDAETGNPRVQVTGAHGVQPPGEIGDVVSAAPEMIHREDPAAWEDLHEPTGEESKLIRGPAQSVGQMTPDEFKTRFPGVPQAIYVRALTAQLESGKPIPPEAIDKHPELAEIAKENEIRARFEDLRAEGVTGNEQPIMDLIRSHGGMNIASLKESGMYGELRNQDLLQRGLARHDGPIQGWDHAAELAWEAGLIPEHDQNAVIDAVMSEARKGTKGSLVADGPERDFPQAFTPRPPKEEWMPERTKAALDAAGIKNGSPITSHGFLDADHGRIKRGEKGTLISSDLENGRLLADFGGKVTLADPRDIMETYLADRNAPEPPAAPAGRAVRRGVEATTGLTDPDEKMVKMTEAQVLRIKLLNQQKGSIVAAQAVRQQLMTGFWAQLRAGKDIRKTLAMFTREALAGLKINNIVAGKLMGIVATSKNDHDFTQALLTIEDTINLAYSKELIGEIRQVYERAEGAPGVEVGWQQRMREARADISFTKPSEDKVERAKALQEYMDHVKATGQTSDIPAPLREKMENALKRPLSSLSVPELEELRDTMLSLEQTGRMAQKFKEHAALYRKLRLIQQMTSTGKPIERADVQPRRPGDPQLPVNARIRNNIGTETDFWQDKGRAILAPHVMFDMADGNGGYAGGHSRELAALNGAYHDASQFAYQILKPVHDIIERSRITPEEFEKTAIVLIRNQEGGLKHLAGDRWLGETDAARLKYAASLNLDGRQKELAKTLLAIGNDPVIFKAIADDIRARQNREVKKVENWYPFVNNYSRFGDMPLNERLGDAFENRFARKEVAHGYTIERQGGKTALRYDLAAFEKIVHDIAYQVKAGASMQLFSEAVNSDQYERAMGPFWTRWMRKYGTLLASRGGTEGARRSEMIQKITRNMATYGLGWRIASAFSHVGLLPLAANEIGWAPVRWGLANYGDPKYASFLRDNVPEFRESTKGAAALEAVRDAAQPANARGAAFKVYDSARRMFAGSIALGAYKHWHDQRGVPADWKNPKREALLYAAAIMTRTQGSPLYKDVPLALSAGGFTGNVDVDRSLLQFHQPILARWSYFIHDIKHLGWDTGDRTGAAAKMANLMLGIMLEIGVKESWRGMIGAIVGGIFGAAYAARKNESMTKRFALHVLGSIPFMDNLMAMGLYHRTGIPALDAIQSIPAGVVTAAKAIEAGHRATALHATVNALSGLAAVAAGVPGGSIVAELANKGISANTAAHKKPTIPRGPKMPRPQ